LLAGAVFAAGCSAGTSTSAETQATAATPTAVPSPAAAAGNTTLPLETDMAGFVLTSPSFAEGGAIPTRYSCDGTDLSPALHWEGAPAGTRSFALIVDDPDAGGFVHWVAYGIAGGTSGSLVEGLDPAGPPTQGRNDFGRTGYGGPCPPGGTHHYRFTLYALSDSPSPSGGATASALRTAIKGLILAQTTLTATYTRQR
jgi:Raf kinase inhibitor-like YbhB/YbcL family protein